MEHDSNVKTVIAVYQRLLEAWNRRRADEFAAVLAADGNVVGFDGSPMDGRQEVASTLASIFADHQTATYVAKVREVRLLRPDVALLRSVVGMVPPGQAQLNQAVNAIQSVLLLDQDGTWQVALLHNTPAAFHGRPEMAAQLTAELTEVLRRGQVVWND